MAALFPNGSGLFQMYAAHNTIMQELFKEHDKEFKVLTWTLNSPDLNLIERLSDMLDKEVRSMETPSHYLYDLKDLLLTF